MLLTIQHLSIHHQKDLRTLVQDLSLRIHTGDKVAIIGEEGNGKSSLLQLLLQEPAPDHLLVEGTIQRHFSAPVYLPQTLPKALAELSLNDYFFADPDELDYGLVYRYADQLSFDSQRLSSLQSLASLSGGETLKIQLIRALASPADIFFLDEPSNDLDLDSLLWLEHFVATCPQAVVFVSHDEDFLNHTATKIIHLESLKRKQVAKTQVWQGNYPAYKEDRKQRYRKQKQQAQNERKEFEKTMDKHRRQKAQVRHSLINTHDATAGRLVAKKMKQVLGRERRFEQQREELTQAPLDEEAIQLFFSNIQPLPAKKSLLKWGEFTLPTEEHLHAQDKIGIIGANGIGKSTLLKRIYQEMPTKTDIRPGYMPQQYQEMLPDLETPLQFLCPSGDQLQEQKALTHLAQLQFTRQEVHHAISDLSGGQQAKLLLLKLVLDQANLLLLDEPSRNFSPTSQPQIRQLFQNYPGAIIAVSHDRRFLHQVCDRVYRLTEAGLVPVDNF